MRSSFVKTSCGVVLALVLGGGGGVLAEEEAVQEMVVYVNDAQADTAGIELAVKLETGKLAPDFVDRIASKRDERGLFLTYRLKDRTDRDVKAIAGRLKKVLHVTDVFVNQLRKAKGAPSTMAVVDGDLEPRVIRDQPALGRVSLQSVGTYGTGAGMVVAVLDAGFDLRHEALAGRIHAAQWDMIDDDADPQDLGNKVDDDADGFVDNCFGHGTFAASLILAGAPDAKILPIRVLDDEGWGDPACVARAIQYAIEKGANVINMSLVVPNTTEVVRDAITAALDAGISVVASGGNEKTWQNDPVLAKRVLTVGALNPDNTVASFSAMGPHVHVYAPGVDIVGAFGGDNPNAYARWQGTSFSAPIVAAAVTVLRGARPAARPEVSRDLVMDTATPIDDLQTVGRGRLNAERACAASAQ